MSVPLSDFSTNCSTFETKPVLRPAANVASMLLDKVTWSLEGFLFKPATAFNTLFRVPVDLYRSLQRCKVPYVNYGRSYDILSTSPDCCWKWSLRHLEGFF